MEGFSPQLIFDIEVRHFRDYLLGLCAEHNVRTDVGVCAIAEVIGIAAATLDEQEGCERLDDRLHEVCERVKATYDRRRKIPVRSLAMGWKQ